MKTMIHWKAIVFAGLVLRIPVKSNLYPVSVNSREGWRIVSHQPVIGAKLFRG